MEKYLGTGFNQNVILFNLANIYLNALKDEKWKDNVNQNITLFFLLEPEFNRLDASYSL